MINDYSMIMINIRFISFSDGQTKDNKSNFNKNRISILIYSTLLSLAHGSTLQYK